MSSPYKSDAPETWLDTTKALVDNFPINPDEIIDVVMEAWENLYSSSFGSGQLVIGKDIFLPAQATGVILEKLISGVLSGRYPKTWKSGSAKIEKDVVNLKDDEFSFEIKTSSSASGLYGNRSTGFKSSRSKKSRTGYYLVINYLLPKEDELDKKIIKIRLGWIDDEDWVGQAKASGQAASIGAKLAKVKLITIYEA